MAFVIILSWCFVVACGCALGFDKELLAEQVTTKQLRIRLGFAQQEKELARAKAKMLLEYVDSDREYRAFDDVLKDLPRGCYRGQPKQHQIMEAKKFDLAAYNAVSEPCLDSMTITVLAFDAVSLYLHGMEYTGWERGGWVMVPREALFRGENNAGFYR